jgi:hypothetical protein
MIEYDIREDQPEGTDVFVLEISSNDLIDKLVRHRFPGISPVDARTVAQSSDGNARVAIALAGTIGNNETIAAISDWEILAFPHISTTVAKPSIPAQLLQTSRLPFISFESAPSIRISIQ